MITPEDNFIATESPMTEEQIAALPPEGQRLYAELIKVTGEWETQSTRADEAEAEVRRLTERIEAMGVRANELIDWAETAEGERDRARDTAVRLEQELAHDAEVHRGEVESLKVELAKLRAAYEEAADERDRLHNEGVDAMAERLLQETNMRSMDFRNGMSMEIEPARALAANFVGAARAMLGDAPNYSETPVEFEFGLAGQPERFVFIAQRVGKLTPHQARQQAERERDEIRAECEDWHQKAAVLHDAIERVRAVCDKAEHGALRWEDPLPVPDWVARVRRALVLDGSEPADGKQAKRYHCPRCGDMQICGRCEPELEAEVRAEREAKSSPPADGGDGAMSYPTFLERVEREIREERDRQDATWGEQNHPDYDPHDIPEVTRNLYAFRAERWKEINAQRAAQGGCEVSGRSEPIGGPCTAWDGVLLEEVYEALAEDDPAKLRAELIQVAAVAQQWIEAIDRRASGASGD